MTSLAAAASYRRDSGNVYPRTLRAGASRSGSRDYDHGSLTNSTVIGRLLEEISWEGQNVRAYRDGGRGRENVLTAEVLWPLSCLPRDAFLAEVLRHAHGAEANRLRAAAEAEEADVMLLPDEIKLGPKMVVVQPDASIISPSTFVLVEAKRIRPSSFQAHQLPRELVALVSQAGARSPLLLLVLKEPPPVPVAAFGRLSLHDALTLDLPAVLARTPEVNATMHDLVERLPNIVAWITWAEIAELTRHQRGLFHDAPHGLRGTVQRLTDEVTRAIEWHG